MHAPRHLVAVLVLLSIAGLTAQGKPDLHVGSKAGDKQRFRQTTTHTQSAHAPAADPGGNPAQNASTITQVFEIEVLDRGIDGSLTANLRLLRVHGALTLPKATAANAFDSADPDGEGDRMGIGKALAPLLGQPIGIQVARNGEVAGVRRAAEATAAGQAKPPGMAAQLAASLLSDAGLQQLAQSAFGRLPDTPIAVGEGFDRSRQQQAGNVEFVTSFHYTLEKADEQQVEMAYAGTITMPAAAGDGDKAPQEAAAGRGAAPRAMPMRMKIQKSKVSGRDVCARATGMILTSQQITEMSMAMPGPRGDDMVVDSRSEVVTERATDADVAPAKRDSRDP